MPWVLAVWLIAATSVSATIATEPALVSDGEPFRVVAVIGGIAPPGGDPAPRVEIDGQEILVHVRLDAGGFTGPPTTVSFTAEVAPLSAGQYEVRILVHYDEVSEPEEVESRPLTVGGTHVSASIAPGFAVAGEPFELTLRGEAPAPCTDVDPYLADGVLVVPLHLDCSVVTPPPPPTPFEFVTTPVTLPAGIYPIVVGSDFSPYIVDHARGVIEVVPSPVSLHDGLFQVSVGWEDFDGFTGDGRPARVPSNDSALFWFFGPDNWELMVKVLDACDVNGKYWVLGAASTTVAYEVEILGPDSQSWTFANSLGQPSEAFADVEAFDCAGVEPPPDPDPEPPPDLPPDALSHFLTLEPAQVVPGLPVRAVINGLTSAGGLPGVQRVERIGRTIRVHLDLPDGGILAFTPYVLSADLGFLDAGTWQVQAVGESIPGALVELARTTIEVAESVESRVEPRRPLSDDDVQLFVQGFGTCPSVELETIIGRKITALWSPGGCLSPPAIFELGVPLGLLDAGSYEVEVRAWNAERTLLGGTTFEGFDAPVALQAGRFQVDVGWRDFDDNSGRGRLVQRPSNDSALFWFFGPDNWELMVKVLDACDVNGHYWVLGAASTTVEYEVTLTDQVLGGEWTFHNDLGVASPAFADVEAFACD